MAGEYSHCDGVDKPKHECGVFAVMGSRSQAAQLTYLGLYALQHRGQESAGMVVGRGKELSMHKGMGLVSQVFDEDILGKLQGDRAIGHVRYSTTGGSNLANAQPILAKCSHGDLALAHNGNLVNSESLRRELSAGGSIFHSTTDSELILHLMARQTTADLEAALIATATRLVGGYALVVMDGERILGLRDPNGIRPLSIGKQGETYFLASESCALENLGVEDLGEVEPGEMVILEKRGIRRRMVFPPAKKALCAFEYIYIARPDSHLSDLNVHMARKRIGAELAREFPVEADLVIGAPESGNSAAMGFAEAAGLPYEVGLIKNRYVGRTFIQPSQELREMAVRIKMTPNRAVLEGKRVVLVDDSIVRGTTSQKTVELLREGGAREVHMVVASPPYRFPCYYGIDTSQASDLIANSHSLEEIRQAIGADGLVYLSEEGLIRALEGVGGLCMACFSGEYPTDIPQNRK